MKQRPRIYYSGGQKAMMWDRWQRGESLHDTARSHTEKLTSWLFPLEQTRGGLTAA
jgi:hypothetical protein